MFGVSSAFELPSVCVGITAELQVELPHSNQGHSGQFNTMTLHVTALFSLWLLTEANADTPLDM